jgi:tetratricopeptide (TPR) repeat protein
VSRGRSTNNGALLLESLGYTPIRRKSPAAFVALAVLAVAAAGYFAWSQWPSAMKPTPPQITSSAPVTSPPAATVPKRTAEPTSGTVPPPAPPVPAVDTHPVRVPSRPAPAVRTASITTTEADDFNLAVYHQRAGDFDTALLKYRAVLQRNERNAQARNNVGLLYLDKGLLEDAVRELRRALTIDPAYSRARTNLGVALMRQHQLDAAASEFGVVLAQDPRDVDALVNLALVERAGEHDERAKDLLIRALSVAPRNAWAHYNLAVVFDHSGEVARAVEHYRAFLDNAGPDVSARAPDVRARLDALTRR